ncbi:hypothetical protein VN97_g10138 [Penicillium thymicola]|uniref:Uncharacterized protein n=1 Tax=Penicillium thymicola TaxID=293382 RepID=A0AAI9X4M9_PENTH|nr:hypothetical protein VN97_g10138 [Penicillium thymicola]
MPGRCPWRKVQSGWRDKTSKQTEVKLTKCKCLSHQRDSKCNESSYVIRLRAVRRQECPQISLHWAAQSSGSRPHRVSDSPSPTSPGTIPQWVGLRAQAIRDVIRLRAVRRQRTPSESSSRGNTIL